MYDKKAKLISLAEESLFIFFKQRIKDLGIENSWYIGLKDFVYENYPKAPSSYEKLNTFFQKHEESEVIIDQLDITALACLFDYYLYPKGIYDLPNDALLFRRHIQCFKQLRNTFDHYTQKIIGDDEYRFFYDQLYYSECVSSFAILVMKHYGPSDIWKKIYTESNEIHSFLSGERWLYTDKSSIALSENEDFSELLDLAEHGNVTAMVKVGKAYYTGERIKRDYEKAYMWFRKASKNINAEAEYYISKCYQRGCSVDYDYDTGQKWLKASAEHGYAQAQYEYTHEYWSKHPKSESDIKNLLYWLKLAAEQDHADSFCALAIIYMNGVGVSKDINLAKKYYIQAASLGSTTACEELAKQAVGEKNYKEAIEWYTKALDYDPENRRTYEQKIRDVQRYLSKN